MSCPIVLLGLRHSASFMTDFFFRHADAAQILLFAGCVSILWAVEHVLIALPGGDKLRHSTLNALFVLTALPIELVLSVACLGASHWASSHHVGLVWLFPDPGSPWLRYGVVFVLLDLGDYVYHRFMHHTPWLWRFHLVHHTDQVVDSSTTVREHPGETIIRGMFLVLWTLLLGASYEVLLLRQAAETVSAVLAHSAVRMPERLAVGLGWLFVTPNLHHVHHHHVLPYTDRNFGGVLSIWDRLFGTFAELEAADCVFGLDTHMAPEPCARFTSLIGMPFEGDPHARPAAGLKVAEAG